MRLVEKVAESYYGANTNECRLTWGFIMQQSGYMIRFAHTNRLIIPTFASEDAILDSTYYTIAGYKFYPLINPNQPVFFCDFNYPGEQTVSMAIPKAPILAENLSSPKSITVHSYPDIHLSVSVNKNLLDFYSDYPKAFLGQNIYSRWAIYANMPISKQFRAIYPQPYDKRLRVNHNMKQPIYCLNIPLLAR